MKLSDCFEYQLTGPCKVHRDKIIKCFGMSAIHHLKGSNTYRMTNQRLKFKITLYESDALYLIEKLNLVEVPDSLFNASTFMTKERLEKIYGSVRP